jgi:spermidine synthase
MFASTTINRLLIKDYLLLAIMAVGAACGIIYEYLLAHYSGRILGSVDVAVYGIIGIMVASMGIGAFFARSVVNPYTGFAWLEAIISILGGTSILILAGVVSVAFILPTELSHTFGLDQSLIVEGGIIFSLREIAKMVPYLLAAILGFLIGMEIPFIARIREDLYSKRLLNNVGTVYGIDYIGGGIGAVIWILVCLNQPIIISAAATALLNLILGAVFISVYWKKIKLVSCLIVLKLIIAVALIAVLYKGEQWVNSMNSMLYKDKVVYSKNTHFQNLVITERKLKNIEHNILNLYINGRLQFSSADEKIYHSFLVTPAMLASASNDNVLIVGGGDGLALREVLKYQPNTVTLVDLDPEMVRLFQGLSSSSKDWLKSSLIELNNNSLNDPRVTAVHQDAFLFVDQLVSQGERFNTIIVDLPDPSHPDLNKLYSDYFYSQLSHLLNGDGALVIQSTSPYHTKKAFQSIGLTAKETGMIVNQYHANIPSFGEWGWTIATKRGESGFQRLSAIDDADIHSDILTKELMLSAFSFPKKYFDTVSEIEINRLNSPILYTYHSDGWRKNEGVYITH